MKIKGILFDKDGTLIDFQSIWLQAADEVVDWFVRLNRLSPEQEMKETVLHAMGVEDHKVISDGPLAYQTYYQIGKAVCMELAKNNIILEEGLVGNQLSVLFESVIARGSVPYKMITELGSLFQKLHTKGYYLGLATADTLGSVKKCFQELGVGDIFDFLGCDDGVMNPKPDRDMFERFAAKFDLQPEQILMVGDTVNDMDFAHKCGGIGVGVLSGLATKEDFAGKADYIIDSIAKIPEFVEEYNKGAME